MNDEEIQKLAEVFVDRTKLGVLEFGTYHFFDKGAREVVDLTTCLDELEELSGHDIAKIFENVLELDGEYGAHFISGMLYELQYIEDSKWDEIMSHKDIEPLY